MELLYVSDENARTHAKHSRGSWGGSWGKLILIIFLLNFSNGHSQSFAETEMLIRTSGVLHRMEGENSQKEFNIENEIIKIEVSTDRRTYKVTVQNKGDDYSFREIEFHKNTTSDSNIFTPFTFSHFFNGVLSGVRIKLIGNLLIKSSYRNGFLEGKEITYEIMNKDTIIQSIVNYKKGKLNGDVLLFNDNRLSASYSYYRDIPKGKATLFHQNGTIRGVGKYRGYYIFIKKQHEEDFEWYLNGKKKIEVEIDIENNSFVGLPNYVPSNFLTFHSGFKYPRRSKKWKFYDEYNNLIHEINYKR